MNNPAIAPENRTKTIDHNTKATKTMPRIRIGTTTPRNKPAMTTEQHITPDALESGTGGGTKNPKVLPGICLSIAVKKIPFLIMKVS